MNIDIKKIKLENYILVKLNPYNIRQRSSLKKLNNFDVKCQYLWNLYNDLKKDNNSNNLSFLIKKSNKYVGFFWISEIYDNNKVSCACAIQKKYRSKGICSNVTNLVSEYLLNDDNIKTVVLDIDSDNYKSKKAAYKAGFRCTEKYGDLLVYTKSK